MDVHSIQEIVTHPQAPGLSDWRDGDGWLGGGTWLFSEPQPDLRRLIDLDGFGWAPIALKPDALSIAATCTIRDLNEHPREADWTAGRLIGQCCDALLGSFKIWNMATVGGNICLALPAGPMTSLAAALGATCVVWTPEGGKRLIPAEDFVVDERRTALRRGELLRSVEIPLAGLRSRSAFRQISLTPLGRSAALLIGLVHADGGFALTITASTTRPVRLTFPAIPSAPALREAIEDADLPIFDDVHGRPDWRRHITFHLAEEIRGELAA